MNVATATRSLLPGRSIVLSKGNGYVVTAERSCNGKTLRIVRSNKNGFEVIHSETWS